MLCICMNPTRKCEKKKERKSPIFFTNLTKIKACTPQPDTASPGRPSGTTKPVAGARRRDSDQERLNNEQLAGASWFPEGETASSGRAPAAAPNPEPETRNG